MMYAKLLEEKRSELMRLHKRSGLLVRDVYDKKSKYDVKKSDKLSKAQLAWDLYTLSRGRTHMVCDDNRCEFRNFKLEFESLEELDLKLAVRGY